MWFRLSDSTIECEAQLAFSRCVVELTRSIKNATIWVVDGDMMDDIAAKTHGSHPFFVIILQHKTYWLEVWTPVLRSNTCLTLTKYSHGYEPYNYAHTIRVLCSWVMAIPIMYMAFCSNMSSQPSQEETIPKSSVQIHLHFACSANSLGSVQKDKNWRVKKEPAKVKPRVATERRWLVRSIAYCICTKWQFNEEEETVDYNALTHSLTRLHQPTNQPR